MVAVQVTSIVGVGVSDIVIYTTPTTTTVT